ncbi:MAG TPA: DUF1569 domain-containing protein [Longimicrobiaceae bacterium]|jgi:hypothetical protein
MKNLYDPAVAEQIKERLARLTPDSERQWGTMSAAQMVAHCAAGLEPAVGDRKPPRIFIGRIIGGMLKRRVLGNEEPLRRNTPTEKAMMVADDRDLEAERTRLRGLIDRFVAAGPAGCTTHPHPFFGPLTPQEWAILMYKHLDHHLRQFGV